MMYLPIFQIEFHKTTLRFVHSNICAIFFAWIEHSFGITIHINQIYIAVTNIGYHLFACQLIKFFGAFLLNRNGITYSVKIIYIAITNVDMYRICRHLIAAIPAHRITIQRNNRVSSVITHRVTNRLHILAIDTNVVVRPQLLITCIFPQCIRCLCLPYRIHQNTIFRYELEDLIRYLLCKKRIGMHIRIHR